MPEHRDIGGMSTDEDECPLRVQMPGQCLFQQALHRPFAGGGAAGRHRGAVPVDGLLGGRRHHRVVGEPQVVVSGEVGHRAGGVQEFVRIRIRERGTTTGIAIERGIGNGVGIRPGIGTRGRIRLRARKRSRTDSGQQRQGRSGRDEGRRIGGPQGFSERVTPGVLARERRRWRDRYGHQTGPYGSEEGTYEGPGIGGDQCDPVPGTQPRGDQSAGRVPYGGEQLGTGQRDRLPVRADIGMSGARVPLVHLERRCDPSVTHRACTPFGPSRN